jgi:hypothetical protein
LAGSDFQLEYYERQEMEIRARDFLLGLPRGEAAQASLTGDEWMEVSLLARVTRSYTSPLNDVTFSPLIPGCGVVDRAEADVLARNELIEIKTVTRPFRAYDLRQALTYSAMLYAADIRVSTVTLLNPRRARYVSFSLDSIAAVARGDSAVEMLEELVEWMMGLQVSA